MVGREGVPVLAGWTVERGAEKVWVPSVEGMGSLAMEGSVASVAVS